MVTEKIFTSISLTVPPHPKILLEFNKTSSDYAKILTPSSCRNLGGGVGGVDTGGSRSHFVIFIAYKDSTSLAFCLEDTGSQLSPDPKLSHSTANPHT